MAHFPFDIVGFDLDGTLLDTSGDLAAAVNHALGTIARAPIATERVVAMVGGGTRHMLAQALAATGGCDAATLDRLEPRLLAFYEANIAVHTHAYPGAVAALHALAARGVVLAVATNKVERLARRVLDDLGLTRHFAAILGGDTLGPGMLKPSGAMIRAMIERCGGGRAAFVGDSRFDMAAARDAGVPGIAVSFGFRQQPADQLGGDAVIDRYSDLIAALERLGGQASSAKERFADARVPDPALVSRRP